MGDDGRLSDFTDVDRAARPESLVHYLDATRVLTGVHTYKAQAIALLDLHSGDHVLDAGCGTGEDVCSLAAIVGPMGHAVGVDRSETMIAAARRRNGGDAPGAEFRVADAQKLPFPDGSFDACRADRVLQHVADPSAVLAEMVRVLRTGGRLVISEPDWGTLIVDAPDQEGSRRIVEYRAQRLAQPYIARHLTALVRRLGLENITVVAQTSVIDRYDVADELLDLRATAREAAREALITVAQAEDWLRWLDSAELAGNFFAALTLFTVKGSKPGVHEEEAQW